METQLNTLGCFLSVQVLAENISQVDHLATICAVAQVYRTAMAVRDRYNNNEK